MYAQVTAWQDNDPAVFFIFVLIALVVHFIPSFVAFSRRHASRLIILLLNILMGWTIIGWVLLLVWASKGKTEGLLA